MKKILCFATLLAFFISACNQNESYSSLLNRNQLSTQTFTVQTNKDTVLNTSNGALVSIPAGALVSNNATVQLVIKEAYSMADIIKAGLTTLSNGHLLSSGGMIFINAAPGQEVKISKAINIKIPTANVDRNMQVYKGDSANGQINWVKPEPLTSTENIAQGKALFDDNCASCHAVNKDLTAPALAHILERTPNKKRLYDYTRNSEKFLVIGDPYYTCLFNRWGKTLMNRFPFVTDAQLNNLYAYVENESGSPHPLPTKDTIPPCYDSCRIYEQLKNTLSSEKDRLTKQKADMIIEKITWNSGERLVNADPAIEKVSPTYNQSLYYQFTVEAFGWYNIDALLDERYGSVETKLSVRMTGQYKTNFNLYLVIPSVKVLQSGGPLKDKPDEYGFYTVDGNIHLPKGLNAWIIAMGEAGDQIVFAKQSFVTGPALEISMGLAPISKEAFNAEVEKISVPELSIKANDTPVADTLRKVIKGLEDVEKIKPKNCDCSCFNLPQTAPVSDTSRYEIMN